MNFINEKQINASLTNTKEFSNEDVQKILDNALKLKGLNFRETATLLNINKKEHYEKLFKTASKIKDTIYGNRLVLFAPLYVSNYCSNNCLYCGFRIDNKEMRRTRLSKKEIEEETRLILGQGHKRILMLMGESNEFSFDEFIDSIETAYSVKDAKGNSIRRINIEIAPLTEEEFKKLSKVKIGTYTVFQETYHNETYQKMHPSGLKSNYDWRLTTMDRALSNGMNDVGIGALFGLYDYKFEVLALLQHSKHLDGKFGVGPHTISVPRIEFAQNAPAANCIPHPVSDINLKKIVAVLRCAVPYTGIILSTRESATLREELFNLGVSQISAGSKTNPGGYHDNEINPENKEQFEVNDTRSCGEIIHSVIEQGFVPSFCTGCYRKGRVGQDFMDLAKPGLINLHCMPNALTTLQEYLEDYADADTKKLGEDLIKKHIDKIPSETRIKKTKEYLEKIKKGERDLYF